MIDFSLVELFANQYFLLFLAVLVGLAAGKVRWGHFKLGISGTLFSGIAVGWSTVHYFKSTSPGGELPEYAEAFIRRGVIDEGFFYFFLIIFVAAVGLLAAKDIGTILKKYGLLFAFLGTAITFSGALVCYLFVITLEGMDPYAVAGVYTGALTSSPGLGAAIEAVTWAGPEAQQAVAAGHALAYPFGVIIVIAAVHLFPVLFKIDVPLEAERLKKEMAAARRTEAAGFSGDFDLAGFSFVCLIGYALGKIEISTGPLGLLSLGSTGGVLAASLILGHKGRFLGMNFRMNNKILTALRQLSLAFFLAVVGLRFGYSAVATLLTGGSALILVTLVSGSAAAFSGFLLGRYVFRINWVLLAGALCGGMTSTPGLGAAIDSTQSDDAASGYGATYPIALFFMVLFTILLHKLPVT